MEEEIIGMTTATLRSAEEVVKIEVGHSSKRPLSEELTTRRS